MNKRALALDALRGIAIIGMVLSGTVAHSLPAWMYHAQVGPRSNFKFDPSFVGITWVDLVFPFFLFAMGAAIPLALSRKLDKGVRLPQLLPAVVKRTFLLVLFAIGIYHCSPYRLGGEWNYVLALVAFALFFLSFVRFPQLSELKNSIVNWGGIVALVALIAFHVWSRPEVFSKGFKLSHNDIIILVLANMAFWGTLSWLFTRFSVVARLGILAVFFALRLTSGIEGSWNELLWNFNPAQLLPQTVVDSLYNPSGWLFRMDFLKYLFVLIPGTIVGDALVHWFADEDGYKSQLPSNSFMITVAVLMLGIVISNLVCLYMRHVALNAAINILWSIVMYYFMRNPKHSLTRLYFKLYQWGMFWLLLGTAFEAFEGGIRKDSATMSYFFVSAGLAIFTLLFFSIVMDYFKNNKSFRYVAEIGQNPMLAYVAGTFFVLPLFVFSGIMPYITKLYEINPWFGLIKGLLITAGMMAVTIFTVRKKWFWKT